MNEQSSGNLTVEKTGDKYCGTILSIPGKGDYAFIGIQTVKREDGGPPDNLKTKEDIFLHRDDCADPLRVGMLVEFYAGDDRHRGAGNYRAFGAMEIIEGELLPSDEQPIPGFDIVTRASESGALVPVTPRVGYHAHAKEVPIETVEQAIKNDPMPSIPRGINDYTETEKQLLLSATLNCFFPTLANFNASYSILDMSDEQLESAIAESQANLTALGMHQQLEEILSEVERFKKMKATLRMFYDEGLIRPETIIPVKYLPDLFVAVPVWYFWIKPEKAAEAEKIWKKNDPEPQSEIRYFCNLFPNQAWAHTYQMFNRRMRSLTKYQGDKIPPFVSRKLCKAMELFDFIVIATPYHEKAGQDWQDLEWLHLIDPYVLGFKVGIPFFFVLARFSDTGTFPLYNEMIADTIGFLQANMEKLRGFNQVNNPYWYHPDQSATSVQQLGTILIKHTHELIDHFEKGDLFDWLRGNSSHTDLIKQQFDGHAFSPPDERGDGT